MVRACGALLRQASNRGDRNMEWIDEADGVFRGGGVKGLGLAGALLGFAEHPEKPVTRWVNVAGASAGAIIACYLAAGHDATDIAELMTKTKFGGFQDFPWPGKVVGGGVNLLRRHGLARGEAFRRWFNEELEGKTFASVKADDGVRYRLKLIAVDVTNRSLLVLPEDLRRYRRPGEAGPIDPDRFELADAARMSMSIPYFFEPVILLRDRVVVEDQGAADGLVSGQPADRIDVEEANEVARHFGVREASFRELTANELKAQQAVIVDGGTLSNFPVWLFDVEAPTQQLLRPTFGFTLKGGRGVGAGFNVLARRMPWAVRFGFDIFHTSQEAWDTRFVSRSTRVRTIAVDAGNIATTQFNLTKDDQALLLRNGRDAAKRFLDRFDLADYENTFRRRFVDDPATNNGQPDGGDMELATAASAAIGGGSARRGGGASRRAGSQAGGAA
jgi:NTE family protein